MLVKTLVVLVGPAVRLGRPSWFPWRQKFLDYLDVVNGEKPLSFVLVFSPVYLFIFLFADKIVF